MQSEPTTAAEVLERARASVAWRKNVGVKRVRTAARAPYAYTPPEPTTPLPNFVPFLGLQTYVGSASTEPPRVTMRAIAALVCKHYGITVRELMSSQRKARVAMIRQIAMHMTRRLTDNSYPQIGKYFGNRDHSTAVHADQKIGLMVKEDPDFAYEIEYLCSLLGGADGRLLGSD